MRKAELKDEARTKHTYTHHDALKIQHEPERELMVQDCSTKRELPFRLYLRN